MKLFVKLICNFNRNIWGVLFFMGTILASCTEEPAPIAVSLVTLDSTSMTLVEGETQKLTATVTPSNAENKVVIWTSSDSSVASVNDGLVTAIKVGKATITVKTDDGGKTATCEVTVNAKVYPVESVTLDKTSYEMAERDEFTLTATVKPDNATNKKLTWSSSNTSVATVSNGKVMALKPGNATITVKTDDGGKTATCEVIIRADISALGTANCYIVKEAGFYKFTPSKGNSNESVGTITSVDVLWETFGTNQTPNVGDLITNVKFADGLICFDTPKIFKEGNAVIAAKDANGKILWSWHIWLTDQPEGQVYYNNAGTMMDRNLGATSATPGDVGALGLLYQWGRKDPFLGSSSISSNAIAKSTIYWPSAVSSITSWGTIAFATANPTTFIRYNSNNYDWYYTTSSSTDNTRWTTSESSKSIYDPCPAGWRVPDGGSNGVWAKAIGSLDDFQCTYNSTNGGMNFSGKFGNASTIWYPASGFRSSNGGSLADVGKVGLYWSASPIDYCAFALYFDFDGGFFQSFNDLSRAGGQSVRCLQESK